MQFEIAKKQFKTHKTLLANFSYMTVLQVFLLLTPLITYPYLTRVLGTELYGLVITAQILASYATIVVRFGFDAVSARHISIWSNDSSKLSEIMSSILSMRLLLWIISFVPYIIIVLLVPIYREHFWLFFYSFGLTLNVLLFPQFFFQGVERMKFITYINIGIQTIFIILTFIIIKSPSDYLWVPILYVTGYLLGGTVSLYIIYKGYELKFYIPSKKQVSYYFKDALPLFATDAVCTVKDKLNYLLLGVFVCMNDVVIYDLGSKLTSLAVQPLTIVNTVIFPKMSREKSVDLFYKFGLFIFIAISTLVVLINIFLSEIVYFFVAKEVGLLPLRLFLLSPIFLGISSYVASNFIVARGYNKVIFYSIIITTSVYLGLLFSLFAFGHLNTVTSFVFLTVISYLVEMIYRLYKTKKIINGI